MLVMLRHTPFVAHLMLLVMVLNLPEQCSFQYVLFHLLFTPKSDEKSASRMDISLQDIQGLSSGVFPRYFYCGKTTVISVQAVTVIKHNYRYRASRYPEKHIYQYRGKGYRGIHNLPLP